MPSLFRRLYPGGVTRRTKTLLTAAGLVVVLAVLAASVPVPYVALGPGPTYNTLGTDDGTEVIAIKGGTTFPTGGNLNMTTVAVRDDLSLVGAVGLWFSGRDALVPRETVYPPEKTTEQIQQQNTEDFQNSESSAVTAALSYLGYPSKVTVAAVSPGSPAEGILAPGDRLTSIDSATVSTAKQVTDALGGTRPGQTVRVGYRRGAATATAEIKLGPPPPGVGAETTRGFIGVTQSQTPDVPFTVDISLANIGGPSAGLMFALGVVDKLTPGQLNGGKFVAGTGTIDDAGGVGPIGGIPFKLVAAREAGATAFLVPSPNCAEAAANVPAGLELVRVDSLKGAVGDLGDLTAGRSVPHC